MGHRARHCDLDPISRTPYGPAARNVPHQEAAHTTVPDLTATDFGTTSGLPTRGASTYVGWLPRLSVPDTPLALATLGRQNLHTRTLRSPIRAVSTTGKTAMSEAFQRHPEGGSNSASGTSIRLLKSLNGTSCEDRTDGSYRRVASLRTACTWFSALRRNPMVCRVKRRMPARMDRLARSTMDVDMRAGSGSPIRWVLRMRGGSES